MRLMERAKHRLRLVSSSLTYQARLMQFPLLLSRAGTIVSAPMGARYLLTADHCFVDKTDISGFQYWLLVFNYNAPCRSQDTPGPIRQVVQVSSQGCHPYCCNTLAIQGMDALCGGDARCYVSSTCRWDVH